MSPLLRSLAALALLSLPAAALEVPFLTGRVNDEAGVVSPEAEARLESSLKAFEARTGHQVAVLILPSLEGEVLEDFSIKVARTWKLGRAGKNDGVLLLVAKDDRKMRVEVGYGLEGSLPDALAGRIIRAELVPHFRAGDFSGGIEAGVGAILAALDGKYEGGTAVDEDADISRRGNGGALMDGPDMPWPVKILIGAFVFGLLGLFEAIGVMTPNAQSWVLYFFLIPFWAAFPFAIFGARFGLFTLASHLIGFPLLKWAIPRSAWGSRIKMVGNRVYYGDNLLWTEGRGGSSGSSWGSSGGSSGGGFSAGGGSFGGGGSSGSW